MRNFNRILLILIICYTFFCAVILVRILHLYPLFYPAEGKWKLVWEDDFNGSVLDQAKWAELMQSTSPLKELQAYVYENVNIKNGCLIITSKKEDWIGPDVVHPGRNVTRHYTSGEVVTINNACTYGRFEIRAKLPVGRGILPFAILCPPDGSWPPEIVIMSMVGQRPDTVYFANYSGVDSRHQRSDGSGPVLGPDYSAGFHTFALEWEPHKLQWYIDDVPKFQINRNVPDQPLCLVLGTTVGGVFAGTPSDEKIGGGLSSFPQYFIIDRVRVFQRT
jgi:beta-glucanase (GH16 family)